jgi:hypothetical protein
MTVELQELVADAIDLTGAEQPSLLDADAPVLCNDSLASESIYLVGLIGGKDVGKSSLVNALVGREISEPTSYGAGTETAIAYVHRSAAAALEQMLVREVAGQFRIVTHDQPTLAAQVLLDLPDIDSRYAAHLQLTRRMLRHMLYPIWIQSIEKYADQQPQKLLSAVAEGNDPTNFRFCLNKVDQLAAREGTAAVEQLKQDYAGRIKRTLNLPREPQIFAISATQPQIGDLAALRQLLSSQKPASAVRDARELALRRQDRSLLAWVEAQNLPERAAMLQRVHRDAEELTGERIAAPVLEKALPRLMRDPGHRLGMLEPALHKRMSRWPVVNVIDAVFAPLLSLVKTNLSTAPPSGGVNVDAYLMEEGRSISSLVQATFAQLYRTNPAIAKLYENRRLWDDLPADAAAADLRARLATTIDQQRDAVVERVAGKSGIISPLFRWLLTIGAILWFPFVQPVLQVLLAGGLTTTMWEAARLAVELLGVTYLLKSVTFLLIWFVALWAILRWGTQQRVNRLLDRWNRVESLEDPLSLAGQVMNWIDDLLLPIRQQRERVDSLIQRVDEVRSQLQLPRDAAA